MDTIPKNGGWSFGHVVNNDQRVFQTRITWVVSRIKVCVCDVHIVALPWESSRLPSRFSEQGVETKNASRKRVEHPSR